MKKLALTLPGGNTVTGPDKLDLSFKDIGSVITPILNIVFFVAIFLTFFWLAWGAFAYIMAQGKKEDLAKARARIAWALIGLFVTLLAFFIAKLAGEIFTPSKGGLPF